jgi:hypothetical protein
MIVLQNEAYRTEAQGPDSKRFGHVGSGHRYVCNENESATQSYDIEKVPTVPSETS